MTDQQSELIARLRRECEEVLDGDIEETELDDIVLALLPSATAETEFDDDVVKGAIDVLALSSEHVSVDDRRRLTDAAKQGTRYNQRSHQPLQLVLEGARAERHLDASAVADGLGIPAESLAAYEAGNRPLIQLEPGTLAQWVDQMGVSADIAESAIRRSFSLAGSGPRFGGRQREVIDRAAQEFISQFLVALSDLRLPGEV